MKYGILIGRFQPLHLAHQSIINEIIHDGLHPIIFVGSSNVLDDNKNPFSYIQRSSIIHEIYSAYVTTLPLPDIPNNDMWLLNIHRALDNMNINSEECTVYYYCKEGDPNMLELLKDFTIKTPVHSAFSMEISATAIRANPDANRRYLDGRVLKLFKEKGLK